MDARDWETPGPCARSWAGTGCWCPQCTEIKVRTGQVAPGEQDRVVTVEEVTACALERWASHQRAMDTLGPNAPHDALAYVTGNNLAPRDAIASWLEEHFAITATEVAFIAELTGQIGEGRDRRHWYEPPVDVLTLPEAFRVLALIAPRA